MAREHVWHDDHGPDKIYKKFTVIRNSVNQPIGEDGEFFMVLRPERDYAAWEALKTYAEEVRYRAPSLASEIEQNLKRIEVRENG